MKTKYYMGRYKGIEQNFHPDKNGDFIKGECVVEFIRGGSLKISYQEDNEEQLWSGLETNTGHWALSASLGNGKATLHQMSPDSCFLEGTWSEDNEIGMWRITLPIDTDNHLM
jgi:hypothetical protein